MANLKPYRCNKIDELDTYSFLSAAVHRYPCAGWKLILVIDNRYSIHFLTKLSLFPPQMVNLLHEIQTKIRRISRRRRTGKTLSQALGAPPCKYCATLCQSGFPRRTREKGERKRTDPLVARLHPLLYLRVRRFGHSSVFFLFMF